MARPTAKELHELRSRVNNQYTASDKEAILERIDKEIDKLIYNGEVNTMLRESVRKTGIKLPISPFVKK